MLNDCLNPIATLALYRGHGYRIYNTKDLQHVLIVFSNTLINDKCHMPFNTLELRTGVENFVVFLSTSRPTPLSNTFLGFMITLVTTFLGRAVA
jgi:hypothetical protein